MSRILVYGSLNLDLIVEVDRLPAVGETLLGGSFRRLSGGKGGNQAYAAARTATPLVAVSMVGCVGDDDAGEQLLRELAAAGVDVSLVARSPEPTGTALITVGPDGANTIVVVPGANGAWPEGHVAAAEPRPGDIVVCQLEIPLPVVADIVERAHRVGARAILNAAPVAEGVESVLPKLDLLVVNEVESAQLLGLDVPTLPAAVAARARLAGDLVVTLGERGAIAVRRDGEARHLPAYPVRAVDTVGAGDAFVGGLAAALAGGADLFPAVELGNAAGAATAVATGARRPDLDRRTLLRLTGAP